MLETGAQQFDLFFCDRCAKQAAGELRRHPALGRHAVFPEEDTPFANVGMPLLLGHVRLIQHMPEASRRRIMPSSSSAAIASTRTLTGSRTRTFLPFCVRLSITERLSSAERFLSRYPSRSSSSMSTDAVPLVVPTKLASAEGVLEKRLARERKRSAIHSRSRSPCLVPSNHTIRAIWPNNSIDSRAKIDFYSGRIELELIEACRGANHGDTNEHSSDPLVMDRKI